MTDATLTPSRLWKAMSPEQRRRAASCLWREAEATADQTQAALLVAKQMKFRPKTVMGLDDDRKARYLAGTLEVPDELAARILVVYHLAEQRPMMGAFLDALGIAHENGLIQEEEVKPAAEKIAPAAARIAEQYPAEDVNIYLNTLLCQDPATWGALKDVLQTQGASG